MANTFKELNEIEKAQFIKYSDELKEALINDNIIKIKIYGKNGDVTFIREDRVNQPCDLCDHLEEGDTLYEHSSWDGGINFDYIENIQYCPKCGRKLKKWEER